MRRAIVPKGLAPNPKYSPGIEITNLTKLLFVAGQAGRGPDGKVPDGIAAQAETAFRNIDTILKEAGMTMDDVADVTVYLVYREDSEAFDKARAKWLPTPPPASTKVYISGLADPKMLCEVQVWAAC